LSGLATQARGKYNYVQDMRQLANIYYDILHQTNIVTAAPLNQMRQLGAFGIAKLPVTISQSAASCAFSVAWDDQTCMFTPTTPVGNRVNISMQDPPIRLSP
jgi:hypothetical protein